MIDMPQEDQPKRSRGRPRKYPLHKKDITELDFVELVNIARCRKKEKSDEAYNEILKRMKPKLLQISFKFHIPGMDADDVMQESLLALKTKAIKDYDKDRGDGSGPYPFDKFAILCIRRHLSTNLKASYQNKKRVLNASISLDQERKDSNSDEFVFLADIIPSKDGAIIDALEKKEYFKNIFSKLLDKLAPFEKQVLYLWRQKYSYDEIIEIINKIPDSENKEVKSVDNALSRIKIKLKRIYDKYGKLTDD